MFYQEQVLVTALKSPLGQGSDNFSYGYLIANEYDKNLNL